jgi:hypothetical protein
MSNLYKKLAAAYAPEHIQKQLAEIEKLKRMERDAREQSQAIVRSIVAETAIPKLPPVPRFATVMG